MKDKSLTVNCTLQYVLQWPYHVEIYKKQMILVKALEREEMQLNSLREQICDKRGKTITTANYSNFLTVQVLCKKKKSTPLFHPLRTRTERTQRCFFECRSGKPDRVTHSAVASTFPPYLRWVDKSSSSNLKLL